MKPNQKLKDNNGYEIALFPTEAMYLTTARPEPEHDVLGLDFLPRNTSGQVITGMRCYAPFSGILVYTGNDHNCILESDNKVHVANDEIKYCRVLVAHSFIAPVLGTHYTQGEEFYITGNYGQSTGEHLHMEVALVDDKSERYWNTGGIGLYKAVHMWDVLFVNDTILLRTGDFNWKEFKEPTPYTRRQRKFPWVLYARKLREK